MDNLPIFLNIKGKNCLVVGGGDIAARKASLLIKAGAEVTVVAPDIASTTQTLIDDAQATWIQAEFAAAHADDRMLIMAATDKEAVNRHVYDEAKKRNILVNVADVPELCDFILGSILDRSPILVAISSGGDAPVLARNLRARLETLIPPSYSRLGQLAGKYRNAVKQKFKKLDFRRRFWEVVFQGDVAEHVYAGRDDIAEQTLKALIADETPESLTRGEVYLVGAGPGDPELLSFKALRLMQQADIVFYDRLVSKQVLALVRKEAEQVYVGKQRAWHAVRQEEINRLLLEHAQQGKRVLRLKGGDPFIFGRGGEEIETLAAENIHFQIVPGVTAASGCATYAGIPLTHRDYSQSCVFVTGQLKQGELDLNWSALVQPNQTVVVYMGLAGLAELTKQLLEHGMPADKPAALVQQGTTSNQKVWTSTISELPALAEKEQPIAPTLIIIGEVVELQRQLAWFDTKTDSKGSFS
jgi:uroporphyrin-III C-methyltransferase/precorrin-2 dehydrogenase/sirohydrochlorin ferrochelatase